MANVIDHATVSKPLTFVERASTEERHRLAISARSKFARSLPGELKLNNGVSACDASRNLMQSIKGALGVGLACTWLGGFGVATAQPRGETQSNVGRAETNEMRPPPDFPGLRDLVATAASVTVHWYNRSSGSEVTTFKVYKRNAGGGWSLVTTMPRTSAEDYQWVDTAKDVSGQCYRIAARAADGREGTSKSICTVRPDGFPTGSTTAYRKWSGLSQINQGVGQLRRNDIGNDQHLVSEEQRFGVNLGLGRGQGGNNLKLQRTGTNPEPLMFGEKLALRVWGAGWVKHGTQAFGIALKLDATPRYEWYVLGGKIGSPIATADPIALWNAKTQAFVIPGSRTWGVQMVWRGGPPTPTPTNPPAPTGFKTFAVYNCHSARRPVKMWVRSGATNSWTETGTIEQQYNSSGSCPGSSAPWTTTLTAGQAYLIIAVDFSAPGCSNDPQISSCQRMSQAILGGASGTATVTIN